MIEIEGAPDPRVQTREGLPRTLEELLRFCIREHISLLFPKFEQPPGALPLIPAPVQIVCLRVTEDRRYTVRVVSSFTPDAIEDPLALGAALRIAVYTFLKMEPEYIAAQKAAEAEALRQRGGNGGGVIIS